MDLKGSIVDTNLKIYLNKKTFQFLKDIPFTNEIPNNILKVLKIDTDCKIKRKFSDSNMNTVNFNNKDIENLNKIKSVLDTLKNGNKEKDALLEPDGVKVGNDFKVIENKDETNRDGDPYLVTTDLDWLYNYLKKKRGNGDKVPYLHELLEGAHIEMPKNEVIKRNPVLEARCVKLRAQQEARDYRKMTKGVDNVRMRFPEDSISYQLKQVNRQLIAIGQFIISIFAGFLFGFRGVEWMVGNLDFGFRLLLGVMCALVIALAEIYFLAKKLNEELNVPETIQLGGPAKFIKDNSKQHQD